MWFFKKKKSYKIVAPVEGTLINIEEVKDPAFSSKMLGDGFAIIPDMKLQKTTFVSPIEGKLTTLTDTGHAYGIVQDKTKIECLMHIGMDTVELQGKGFEIKVKQNADLKLWEELVTVDLGILKEAGKEITTPIVFTPDSLEASGYKINILKTGQVKQGEIVAEITI